MVKGVFNNSDKGIQNCHQGTGKDVTIKGFELRSQFCGNSNSTAGSSKIASKNELFKSAMYEFMNRCVQEKTWDSKSIQKNNSKGGS